MESAYSRRQWNKPSVLDIIIESENLQRLDIIASVQDQMNKS
jgi:hypothetical protein